MNKIDTRRTEQHVPVQWLFDNYPLYIRTYAWITIGKACNQYTDRLREGFIPITKPCKHSLSQLAIKLISYSSHRDDTPFHRSLRLALADTIVSELMDPTVILDYREVKDNYKITLYRL